MKRNDTNKRHNPNRKLQLSKTTLCELARTRGGGLPPDYTDRISCLCSFWDVC